MALRTIKKTNVRNRSALDPSVPRRADAAVIEDIEATAANTIQITFETRVQRGVACGFKAGTGAAESVESMTTVSDTVLELVFTGAVAGTNLIVKGDDLGIRTSSGGFVPAGTYPIPTFP